MSIILKAQLSCYETLKTEFPANVVAAPEKGSALKAFSSLKIGVVNLMPTKEATERQWARLMAQSRHWIEPVWIQMASYQPTHVPPAYLDTHYAASEALALADLEGVILTGAPVEHLAFEEVAYWQELCDLIERLEAARVPILAVCWGAQALLYKRYGLAKHPLGKKCFGLFAHLAKAQHPLTRQLDKNVYLPHSRHTGWRQAEVAAVPQLEVLIESETAGIFAIEDAEGDWFWSGHPEYEADTLLTEYERDLSKGLAIDPPRGYEQLKTGRWQPEHQWQETASRLLCNWLDEIGPRR